MQQTYTRYSQQDADKLIKMLVVFGIIFVILLTAGAMFAIGAALFFIWTLPAAIIIDLTFRVGLSLLLIYIVYRGVAPVVRRHSFRFQR